MSLPRSVTLTRQSRRHSRNGELKTPARATVACHLGRAIDVVADLLGFSPRLPGDIAFKCGLRFRLPEPEAE